MAGRSVLIDLDDPRMGVLADVLANKSSKRILSLLAESELSASEVALRLSMPLTTVDYNMKKLARAGLIEKTRSLLSSKGKLVPVYRVSEKRIVISPRRMLRGIVPAFLVSIFLALGLKLWEMSYRAKLLFAESARAIPSSIGFVVNDTTVAFDNGAGAASSFYAEAAVNASSAGAPVADAVRITFSDKLYAFLVSAPNSWALFFIGALCALCAVLLWNWFKER
ncbi:MAG: winged helix-turn-helix domain-containing protein [Nanoarchaeota archaeon]